MSALLVAATAVGAEVRVLGSAEADGKAPVVAVITARATDLVVLDGGHDRGFRPGTVVMDAPSVPSSSPKPVVTARSLSSSTSTPPPRFLLATLSPLAPIPASEHPFN